MQLQPADITFTSQLVPLHLARQKSGYSHNICRLKLYWARCHSRSECNKLSLPSSLSATNCHYHPVFLQQTANNIQSLCNKLSLPSSLSAQSIFPHTTLSPQQTVTTIQSLCTIHIPTHSTKPTTNCHYHPVSLHTPYSHTQH